MLGEAGGEVRGVGVWYGVWNVGVLCTPKSSSLLREEVLMKEGSSTREDMLDAIQ